MRRVRRINWKGIGILSGILVLILLIALPASLLNKKSIRDSALSQAEEAREKGEVDLALRHLDRYLSERPDDIDVLRAKSRILSEAYLPWGQLISAANTLDQLIRLDPQGEGRLETRRKLAEIYIRYSDELKRYADTGIDPDVERQQSRYVAAASIASQLLSDAEKGKYDDPVAHRLLAKAYEGQVSEIRSKSIARKGVKNADKLDSNAEEKDLWLKTIKNFKRAIELDPHDLESPARLSFIYSTWLKDQPGSDKILDDMIKINPTSIPAHLSRYRLYGLTNRPELAQAELEEILTLSPTNVEVRIEAANSALGRRDSAQARRHLDAIPKDEQEDLRVKILRGYMEFAEQHPDDAIDQWRRGLLLVGGSNLDLTWKLAFNLIQLGRYDEADPLRKQYVRLSKGDKLGMGKFLEALFDLGYGRLFDAKDKLEKIKDIVPQIIRADVLLSLGRCYEMIGDMDAALLAFRNASSASPTSPGPRLAIARHLQTRHPEDSVGEVDRALSDAPNDMNLLLESIRLRINRQMLRVSSEKRASPDIDALFVRAEKIAPNNQTLRSYRADYLAISGRLPEAVDLLSNAVKGDGRKSAELWVAWAMGLDRLNRRTEALQVLDQAALPDNVGDRSKIRIAKSRLLTRAGKGQAAREVLSTHLETVSMSDRPELAQALGDLLRDLGDREGARTAYAEWARLAHGIPSPALALLAMAQADNDDKAAKLGLEALRSIGGDKEPYGMAAQALDLIRVDPNRPGPPSADRLYEAEVMIKRLRQDAPSLRIGSLIEGMIFEFRGDLSSAIKSYKAAQKDDISSPAVPRLIEACIKLKRFEDLDNLKREFERAASVRQQPALALEFDRIATNVALKLGEKDRADYYASRMLEGRQDDINARSNYALMLDANNKPEQAEESLRALVKEKPNAPSAWLTLISFLTLRKTPAEVASTIGQARREYKGERPELFLAKCYLIGKDLVNAKLAYKKAVDLRPDDLNTLRALVEYYEITNQTELVEPVLRKVLQIDPSTNWAARFLAMRLSSRADPVVWAEAWALVAPGSSASGDTPEDRLVRATLLARSPENVRRLDAITAFASLANDLPISSPLAIDTRLRLAQAMIEINRFADSWEAIQPIADDSARRNSMALVIAIEALARSNRPDEAERRLERLAILEPAKSPQVAISKGWVLLARGKRAEALASIASAYTDSADTPNAEAIGLAALEMLQKFGDTETALPLATTIARRWPKDGWVLARVLVGRKDFDQALAECQLTLNAGSPREATHYAMISAVNRRTDSAFVKKVSALADSARLKAPKEYNILVDLATIRHLEARYEDEMTCYREALELYPNNVQFLNNMAWTLCEGLNKPDEAMKYVQEAIRREGEAAPYLDTRGVILGRLGDHSQAIADIERSIKGDPSSITYFHLARAYLKANQPAESRRCRDLAYKAGFNADELDPTDRADLVEVMGKNRP